MALQKHQPVIVTTDDVRSIPAVGRLLYVEDDDTNWHVAHLALHERYEMVRARTAQEVVQLLESTKFDLILMDIELKGSDLDGIQITQALRGDFSGALPAYASHLKTLDIPIVFVTAYAGNYSRDMLVRAGGDDCMSKPINTIGLSLIVTRLVVRHMVRR